MLVIATAYRQRRERRQLEKILGGVDLPSFPQIVHEVMAALRDPSSSSRRLGELVSRDPALSVAVLRTVNSAAFATRSRIVDLEQAVTLIGRANVESILVSVGVGRCLRASGVVELRGFWTAAARRALLARAIAEQVKAADPTLAYTSALLCDVAVPLLSVQLPRHRELVEAWRAGTFDDLGAAERERFGWDHGEIGAWLCTNWGLPEALSEAIGQHHLEPYAAPPTQVAVPVRSVAPIGEHLPQVLGDKERQALSARVHGQLGQQGPLDEASVELLVQAEIARADDLAPVLGA